MPKCPLATMGWSKDAQAESSDVGMKPIADDHLCDFHRMRKFPIATFHFACKKGEEKVEPGLMDCEQETMEKSEWGELTDRDLPCSMECTFRDQ
ncbi:hypothetical protein L596_002905 [Steinernema carpocapsae]|uniref:Uncharacterized protein n=1 Tax=Steinernema carpocapsae TaxID=34508 RepID=A0A4U8URH3_STECR|nr:hypothetical protein L596_002905 [Steinernema carpocapsae]